MADLTPKPNTAEQGSPFANGIQSGATFPAAFMSGGAGNRYELLDDVEYQPDLRFPDSVRIFDRMRNDSQVHGLWLGSTLPIRRYTWLIDPNGAREEVVKALALQLNLSIKGEEDVPVGRRQRRFSHDEHLAHALLFLIYGFMYFEQVYDVTDTQTRLAKLSPRMPHSIENVLVDRNDGGLQGIKQRGMRLGEMIPVKDLVAYVWEKEGANWFGRSMLRPLYKDWFIKDKLVRVNALKHQRNGMGVPTLKQTTPDPQPDALRAGLDIAARWRAGDTSAAALPYGIDLELKGVTGTLPETVEAIRYHDEAMARAWLQMFIMLGQTQTGSRALGQTFYDYYAQTTQLIAKKYADTFNEHVVEDWVDINWDNEPAAPLLVYEVPVDRDFTLSDFLDGVRVGAITVDADVENYLRRQVGVPLLDPRRAAERAREPDPTIPKEPPVVVRTVGGKPRRFRRIRTSEPVKLPDRRLRRQPYDFEATAGVDFRDIEETWVSAVDRLVADWRGVREDQVNELIDQIAEARSPTDLLTIAATVRGDDFLTDVLMQVAEAGSTSAVQEAANQGREIPKAEPDEYRASIEVRASATAASMTSALNQSAQERAIALAGGGLTYREVGDVVREHLESLTDSYPRERLGGAVSDALNTGRLTVIEESGATYLYSSELLDTNTCTFCMSIDGTEYPDASEGRRDYPAGGYVGCAGRERCRGMLIAVYEDEGEEATDKIRG